MRERLTRQALEEKKKKSATVVTELKEQGLSTKTVNAISRGVFRGNIEIEHAGDLSKITDEDLSDIHHFGKNHLKEVRSHFPYQPPTEIFPGSNTQQDQRAEDDATYEGMPPRPER